MKADVLPIDGPEHQAVQLLLPWRGNGLLSAEEAARVDAHVASCPRCQADLGWQARLRAVPVDETLPVAEEEAVDRQWSVLRQQITSAHSPSPGPRPRTTPQRHRSAMRWWPMALALQSGVLAIVALAFAWSILSPRNEAYRALGAGAPNAAANALVVFSAQSTQAQMSAALRAGDAQLVGGPTVTDAYLLHLPSTDQAALARLRAQPGVARVEALEAPEGGASR